MRARERYLLKQLQKYKPRLVIAYGADVCQWFSNQLRLGKYIEYKPHEGILNSVPIKVLFIKQRQGARAL